MVDDNFCTSGRSDLARVHIFSRGRRYILVVTGYHNLTLIGGAGTNLYIATFFRIKKYSMVMGAGKFTT